LSLLNESLECYDKAIELNPSEPVYWNLKGDALYSHTINYDEVVKAYEEAIRLNPKDASVWTKAMLYISGTMRMRLFIGTSKARLSTTKPSTMKLSKPMIKLSNWIHPNHFTG
jgi:tetratricopeptide (TPR) repeat protein